MVQGYSLTLSERVCLMTLRGDGVAGLRLMSYDAEQV